MMPKQLLISYTGKTPVEVDLTGAVKREAVKAKKEKRESAFQRLAVVRSGTLSLRQNTTAVVSESELEAVKETLGDRTFARYVVQHGEYKPRKAPQGDAAPEPTPEPQPEPREGEGTQPEPRSPTPEIMVSGKGKKGKGKGK